MTALVDEYKALSSQESLTSDESKRMNAILEQLANSSLTLRDALAGVTGGLSNEAEVVKVLNDYLTQTEEKINNLAREQAAESFKDTGAIEEAQRALEQARANEALWREYDAFLKSEAAQVTNFPTYVAAQVAASMGQTGMYWIQIQDQMLGLVDGWWKPTSAIVNALDNLGLSAQEASSNAADNLDTAWETVEDSLHVFIEGPKTSAMNPYFQSVLEDYFDATIAGIDKEAEVTSEQLTTIAAQLKAKQEELYGIFMGDERMRTLMDQYYEELLSGTPDVETLNTLIEQINDIIETKNKLLPEGSQPLPLLPEITVETLAQINEELEETQELMTSLDASDIYKDLALAKEEANGFATVLSKLGEGEDQLTNLHEAVMAVARELAESVGIVDEKEIAKIG